MKSIGDFALLLLAVSVLFGGLLVWPLSRRRVQPSSTRASLLQAVFWFHAGAIVVLFGLVAINAWAQSSDWLHLYGYLYLVGVISPAASAIVWLVTRNAKGQSNA